jgi:hypothetical protein
MTNFTVWRGITDSTTYTIPDSGVLLYLIGDSNDNIYQYSLSTAFDITSTSFNNDSLNVGNEDNSIQDAVWSPGGSLLHLLGTENTNIYQYDVSEPFDVTTASFNNDSLNVGNEDISPTSLSWNGDGSKLYIIGSDSVNIYEYDVSSAFDITTSSYNNNFLDISDEDGFPRGMAWNDNGLKLYMNGGSNEDIYEYDLSAAFDVTTASYNNNSFSYGTQVTTGIDFAWNNDGSKLHVIDQTNTTIYEYDVSTEFDVTTASYDNSSFDGSNEDGTPRGMTWNGAPQYSGFNG